MPCQQFKQSLNIPYAEDKQMHNLYDFLQMSKEKTKSAFNYLLKQMRRKSLSNKFNSKRNKITCTSIGRPVKIIKHVVGKTRIASYGTIKNAITLGKYDFNQKVLKISKHEFMGELRSEKESMTLILAIDVSNSTLTSIMLFCDVLDSLTKYFRKNNDRIGLIAIKDNKAQVLNYPSHNFKVVLRGMRSLKVSGTTPLYDGLKVALEMAKTEKRIKPGSKSLVILLSDCFPEPLTHKFKDVFDEPAYQNVVRQAGKFKKDKIQLLIIKPRYNVIQNQKRLETSGDKLAMEMIRKSGGKCIDIEANLGDSGIRINFTEAKDRNDDRNLIITSISEELFRN
ncbi:MAG: hypothetical protein A2381_10130 [Bdellovibrionales bacterium RIFOXYB1_FULL_37_110]|nr:MAG: hypothetical protein A2417_02645 [Bdellovibrionales bacterium RIFOXYC1_FULL_37_79]OFZ61122.1 MAG: hypothetical protein A2381_10130 [Bdellovibrionales bacterium RIFOXYB1_FULL_37_110]OFZ61599.1 MAG: hypothetical protein A2577_10450 [Bdellovibrionales bacterium RIFOXYD1_FULL_36_51]